MMTTKQRITDNNLDIQYEDLKRTIPSLKIILNIFDIQFQDLQRITQATEDRMYEDT